jgi:hypothetical protein
MSTIHQLLDLADIGADLASDDLIVVRDTSAGLSKRSEASRLNTLIAGAATATEVARVADVSARLVSAGSTLSITEALHDGKTIKLDTATGSVCTLPASSGSGARFRFVVHTLATSNSHIVKVANATDVFYGFAHVAQDSGDTSVTFETGADSDTVTLNRTTTGSTQKGEWIEVEDIATGVWAVRMQIAATGTEATPFSATVS